MQVPDGTRRLHLGNSSVTPAILAMIGTMLESSFAPVLIEGQATALFPGSSAFELGMQYERTNRKPKVARRFVSHAPRGRR
jgi:hypothetical protein